MLWFYSRELTTLKGILAGIYYSEGYKRTDRQSFRRLPALQLSRSTTLRAGLGAMFRVEKVLLPRWTVQFDVVDAHQA